MSPSQPSDSRDGRKHRESGDQYGFNETKNYLSLLLEPFVPQWLAVRSISISVTTNKEIYRSGEPVVLDISFKNRLPLPVQIETPTSRKWGWTVDGEVAASNEVEYRRSIPSKFSFRAGEHKTIRRVWDGRFKRAGTPTRWIQPDKGEHEISAFIDGRKRRISATTTIRIK